MKKLILSLAFIGFSTFSMAQQDTVNSDSKMQKRAERQQAHLEKMKQELGLNDAQVAKINDLRAREASVRKSKMEAHKADKKALMENHDKEMKTILSPEQYDKWQAKRLEKKKEIKEKMRSKRKHAPSNM